LAGKLKEKSLLYMVDKVMNIKQCLWWIWFFTMFELKASN
jgi:hypothetical protein